MDNQGLVRKWWTLMEPGGDLPRSCTVMALLYSKKITGIVDQRYVLWKRKSITTMLLFRIPAFGEPFVTFIFLHSLEETQLLEYTTKAIAFFTIPLLMIVTREDRFAIAAERLRRQQNIFHAYPAIVYSLRKMSRRDWPAFFYLYIRKSTMYRPS